MPPIHSIRKFEHTMAWRVFVEPGQVVNLFAKPNVDQVVIPGDTPMLFASDGIRLDPPFFAHVVAIALSRPDAILAIESTTNYHRSEHSGPWMTRGKAMAYPIGLRNRDVFRASVRGVGGCGFPDPIEVQIAWVFTDPGSYAGGNPSFRPEPIDPSKLGFGH